jgi:hypothetical protein
MPNKLHIAMEMVYPYLEPILSIRAPMVSKPTEYAILNAMVMFA